MQVIGATTIEEYRKHMERDPALERRFQPVKVDEPTEAETLQILRGLKEKYERHHKVRWLPNDIPHSLSALFFNSRPCFCCGFCILCCHGS